MKESAKVGVILSFFGRFPALFSAFFLKKKEKTHTFFTFSPHQQNQLCNMGIWLESSRIGDHGEG